MYRKKQDLIVGLRKSERDSSIRRTPTRADNQSALLRVGDAVALEYGVYRVGR